MKKLKLASKVAIFTITLLGVANLVIERVQTSGNWQYDPCPNNYFFESGRCYGYQVNHGFALIPDGGASIVIANESTNSSYVIVANWQGASAGYNFKEGYRIYTVNSSGNQNLLYTDLGQFGGYAEDTNFVYINSARWLGYSVSQSDHEYQFTIKKINKSTNAITTLHQSNIYKSVFLDLAIDSNGNLFTVSPFNHTVVKIDSAGNKDEAYYPITLDPGRIEIDANNNIYVSSVSTNTQTTQITKITPSKVGSIIVNRSSVDGVMITDMKAAGSYLYYTDYKGSPYFPAPTTDLHRYTIANSTDESLMGLAFNPVISMSSDASGSIYFPYFEPYSMYSTSLPETRGFFRVSQDGRVKMYEVPGVNFVFNIDVNNTTKDILGTINYQSTSGWEFTNTRVMKLAYTGTNFGIPTADFSADQTTGLEAPVSVQFDDNSTEIPTSWLWNFGDGTTSTQQNPTKVYDSMGTYMVSLDVSNILGGDSEIKNNYITVNKGFSVWEKSGTSVKPVGIAKTTNKVFVATTGSDGFVRVRPYDTASESWGSWVKLDQSDQQVGMVGIGSKLYVSFVKNGVVTIKKYDEGITTNTSEANVGSLSSTLPVELENVNGKLFAVTTDANKLTTIRIYNSSLVAQGSPILSGSSVQKIDLKASGTKVFMATVAADGYLRTRVLNEDGTIAVDWIKSGASTVPVTMESLNGKVYIATVAADKYLRLRVLNEDGTIANDWIKSGSSVKKVGLTVANGKVFIATVAADEYVRTRILNADTSVYKDWVKSGKSIEGVEMVGTADKAFLGTLGSDTYLRIRYFLIP